MENNDNNMNNYKLQDPNDSKSDNQNGINSTNNYLTFQTKKNGPMFIDPVTQARLLKNLMDVLDIINQSTKNFDPISKGLKFKSLDKYSKFFANNEPKYKLKLVKTLYKTLYNEKNPPELKGVLPADMILIINLTTLNEICEYILFSLYCLYNSRNSEQKLAQLLEGQLPWREACTKKKFNNSEELNRFEKAMSYFETLNCFSCFNLEITKNLTENQNIIIENVLLFYLFYEALLKNCLKINIDMTIPKLDAFYSSYIMKPRINTMDDRNVIPSINYTFLKGLLVNYIIMKGIGEHFYNKEGLLLTYQQYDSYIVELYSLFQKELSELKEKEINFVCNYESCNFLFYNVLYYLSPKTGFKLDLNALDPLLFKNIIYTIFIILSNGEPIQNIEISLFPQDNLSRNEINKIYLNHLSFKDKKKFKIPNELEETYYNVNNHKQFNWKNKEDINIISVEEDKIYDVLFEDFNTNLFYLLVLIDKNSQTLSESIKINLPQNLLTKKKYVYSVAYFIFNIFNFLFKKCLSINMSQFKISTNIQLPVSLGRFQKISLRDLKINNLKLKIHNISYILDLNSLPFSTCSLLSLSNLSYDDLAILIEALRNKMGEETVLKHLKLKFGYSQFININAIEDMLRNYSFPKSISYLTLRFKNELSTNEYFEIMWKIINALACSENNPKELIVTVKLYYDQQEDPFSYFNLRQNLTNCFDFDKLNPNYLMIYNFSFREIKENIQMSVELNKYQRNSTLDAFIKISRAADKSQKLDMRYMMPTCLRIIRFMSKFEVESTIKINFVFMKSK